MRPVNFSQIKLRIVLKKNKQAPVLPVLVLFAPTASGKTALSVELFGHGSHSVFKDKAEIISADSMQVYTGMDIGTAKPDSSLLSLLPHHMIDECSPSEQFTVADFVTKADSYCSDIFSRGKLPVVMGGTGFYIRCFMLGLPAAPEADEATKRMLRSRLASEGSAVLYEDLKQKDSVSAARIHPNDTYRIVRALEVFYATGKPRSSYKVPSALRNCYRFCTMILERPRDELYERIDRRVEQMFSDGLEQEYLALVAQGIKGTDPGMQAIGYREFVQEKYEACSAEDRVCRREQLKEQIKTDSRRYAKKQFVFMRDIPEAQYYRYEQESVSAVEFVETVLENFSNDSGGFGFL